MPQDVNVILLASTPQPRDVVEDRLISGPAMRYAYLIAGVVEAGVGTLGYFTIFWW